MSPQDPKVLLPAQATTVEPYTLDELHAIAREIAAKVTLKVVDTLSGLSKQSGEVMVLQTYWGPTTYTAVATPRAAQEFAGTRFGEALQTIPKPRLYTLSVIVPVGALPGHFEQIDTVFRRAALILGANATLKVDMIRWDPKSNQPVPPPTTAAGRLYTGAATDCLTLVAFTWDAGSAGEVTD